MSGNIEAYNAVSGNTSRVSSSAHYGAGRLPAYSLPVRNIYGELKGDIFREINEVKRAMKRATNKRFWNLARKGTVKKMSKLPHNRLRPINQPRKAGSSSSDIRKRVHMEDHNISLVA